MRKFFLLFIFLLQLFLYVSCIEPKGDLTNTDSEIEKLPTPKNLIVSAAILNYVQLSYESISKRHLIQFSKDSFICIDGERDFSNFYTEVGINNLDFDTYYDFRVKAISEEDPKYDSSWSNTVSEKTGLVQFYDIKCYLVEDTFIDLNFPDADYGSLNEIRIGNMSIDDSVSDFIETFMKFDITDIPDNSDVVTVKLILPMKTLNASPLTAKANIDSIDSNWTEDSINFGNVDDWWSCEDSINNLDITITNGEELSINVTRLVKDKITQQFCSLGISLSYIAHNFVAQNSPCSIFSKEVLPKGTYLLVTINNY